MRRFVSYIVYNWIIETIIEKNWIRARRLIKPILFILCTSFWCWHRFSSITLSWHECELLFFSCYCCCRCHYWCALLNYNEFLIDNSTPPSFISTAYVWNPNKFHMWRSLSKLSKKNKNKNLFSNWKYSNCINFIQTK